MSLVDKTGWPEPEVWERPKRKDRRVFTLPMILLTLAVVGGSIGGSIWLASEVRWAWHTWQRIQRGEQQDRERERQYYEKLEAERLHAR